MNKETKETLRKIADYAEHEKKTAVIRRCIITFAGTFTLSIVLGSILFPRLPEEMFLNNDSLWLGVGVIGLAVLWMVIMNENRKNTKRNK
jgi:hypothetical protein